MSYVKRFKPGDKVQVAMKGYTEEQNKGVFVETDNGPRACFAKKYGGMHIIYFPYDNVSVGCFGMYVSRRKE